jgi:ribosomal protein L40E
MVSIKGSPDLTCIWLVGVIYCTINGNMQTCTNCHAQSPDSAEVCVNCGADLRETSTRSVALSRYQANPRVKYVRIIVSADSCPACREMEGAYDKETAPPLPVEECSHQNGCRCFYLPFLTDLYP